MEQEANRFASLLLLPTALLAPLCGTLAPTLADIGQVGKKFVTSLTATARRWAELSPAACAVVESRDGKVREVVASPTFRAKITRRREVEPDTAAAAIARGARAAGPSAVRGGAWGSAKLGEELFEESVAIAGTTAVLTWLRHA